MRRISIIVIATAGLLVGLTLSAEAQQAPVTFSGPVVAGQTITLTCLEGEQVELNAGVPNATPTFYRAANRKHVISSDAPTSSTAASVSWIVPKGAKYADATLSCVPTTTVITASGMQVADERQRVDCPTDYPYVTSTFTFTGDADGDLSTTGDQFPLQSRFLLYLVGNDPGIPNYTGFQFRLDPGMAWTAEVTCSRVPGT